MADWAQVALVVGPAVVAGAATGLTGYFIARHQNQSAERRLQVQLDDARAKEGRDRKREVRSAPLLNLRAELARMAQGFDVCIRAEQLRETSTKDQRQNFEPNYRELTQAFAEDYLKNGRFQQAILQVSDPEILAKAKAIDTAYYAATSNISKSSKWEETNKILENIGGQVTELQELIDKRLEAL